MAALVDLRKYIVGIISSRHPPPDAAPDPNPDYLWLLTKLGMFVRMTPASLRTALGTPEGEDDEIRIIPRPANFPPTAPPAKRVIPERRRIVPDTTRQLRRKFTRVNPFDTDAAPIFSDGPFKGIDVGSVSIDALTLMDPALAEAEARRRGSLPPIISGKVVLTCDNPAAREEAVAEYRCVRRPMNRPDFIKTSIMRTVKQSQALRDSRHYRNSEVPPEFAHIKGFVAPPKEPVPPPPPPPGPPLPLELRPRHDPWTALHAALKAVQPFQRSTSGRKTAWSTLTVDKNGHFIMPPPPPPPVLPFTIPPGPSRPLAWVPIPPLEPEPVAEPAPAPATSSIPAPASAPATTSEASTSASPQKRKKAKKSKSKKRKSSTSQAAASDPVSSDDEMASTPSTAATSSTATSSTTATRSRARTPRTPPDWLGPGELPVSVARAVPAGGPVPRPAVDANRLRHAQSSPPIRLHTLGGSRRRASSPPSRPPPQSSGPPSQPARPSVEATNVAHGTSSGSGGNNAASTSTSGNTASGQVASRGVVSRDVTSREVVPRPRTVKPQLTVHSHLASYVKLATSVIIWLVPTFVGHQLRKITLNAGDWIQLGGAMGSAPNHRNGLFWHPYLYGPQAELFMYNGRVMMRDVGGRAYTNLGANPLYDGAMSSIKSGDFVGLGVQSLVTEDDYRLANEGEPVCTSEFDQNGVIVRVYIESPDDTDAITARREMAINGWLSCRDQMLHGMKDLEHITLLRQLAYSENYVHELMSTGRTSMREIVPYENTPTISLADGKGGGQVYRCGGPVYRGCDRIATPSGICSWCAGGLPERNSPPAPTTTTTTNPPRGTKRAADRDTDDEDPEHKRRAVTSTTPSEPGPSRPRTRAYVRMQPPLASVDAAQPTDDLRDDVAGTANSTRERRHGWIKTKMFIEAKWTTGIVVDLEAELARYHDGHVRQAASMDVLAGLSLFNIPIPDSCRRVYWPPAERAPLDYSPARRLARKRATLLEGLSHDKKFEEPVLRQRHFETRHLIDPHRYPELYQAAHCIKPMVHERAVMHLDHAWKKASFGLLRTTKHFVNKRVNGGDKSLTTEVTASLLKKVLGKVAFRRFEINLAPPRERKVRISKWNA